MTVSPPGYPSVFLPFLLLFLLSLLLCTNFQSPSSSPALRRHRYSPSRRRLHSSVRRQNSAGTPPGSVSIDYIPSSPEPDVCWIYTCADRQLPHAQAFSAPGFRHLRLPMPRGLGAAATVHAVWCRAYYLRELRRTGQKCVVYADDDVFLNLGRLRREVESKKEGEILVMARPEHGMENHINAGFVVFTNLQSRIGRYISDAWYAMRMQPSVWPYHYLRDQMALNRLVKCAFPGVVCYRDAEGDRQGRRLGMIRHCFSVMDKRKKGAKEECMKKLKTVVLRWDAEGKRGNGGQPKR